MSFPLVSVVLPVYNAENYLKEAIDSILNQTYENFELIVIDDGSKDHSLEIISNYKDKRIKVLDNEKNHGIVYTLNKGIENSTGKYILRMDADDISLPDRIEKQVEFMERHPDIGICAGLAETFGALNGKAYLPAITSDEVKCSLLFDTTLAHPTVIMRSHILREHHLRYQNYIAEDYMMWVLALDYCKLYVLPKVVLKYRVTEKSLTAVLNKKEDLKAETYLKAYDIMLKRCGMMASMEARKLQYYFDFGSLGEKDMKPLVAHLKSIIEANESSRYFDRRTLENMIGKRWIAYIKRNRQYRYLISKFTIYGIRYIITRMLNNPIK